MLGLMPLAAKAATVEVCPGCTLSTIGEGVTAAGPAGTVLVHPGTYTESVTLSRDVVIRSLAGSADTVWNGLGTNVITVSENTDVSIIGFTLNPSSGVDPGEIGGFPLPDTARAISATSATVHIEDIHVANVFSRLPGIALSSTDSTITVSSSRFARLASIASGAGIRGRNSDVSVEYSQFNVVTGINGSAVHVDAGQLDVYDSEFGDNGVQNFGRGGSLFMTNGPLVVADSTFVNGSASEGGDVYVDATAAATLRYNGHTDAAADRGGSLFVQQTTATLEGGRWSGNQARDWGGAVGQFGSSAVTVQDAVFTTNTGGSGGAWQMEGEQSERGELTATASRWLSNTATTGGAIASQSAQSMELHNSVLAGNVAIGGPAEGGGLYANDFGSLDSYSSLFCKNNAHSEGAGIAAFGDDSPITLRGSVFVENELLGSSSTDAGAVKAESATLDFEHNTFASNSAWWKGPILAMDDSSASLQHNIYYQSTGPYIPAIYGFNTQQIESDFNLRWKSTFVMFAGDLDSSDQGLNDTTGDPVLFGYVEDAPCTDSTWQPGLGSAATLDSPATGATGFDSDAWDDQDNDGINAPWDCDDSDASVYPGAPEVANSGVDANCDQHYTTSYIIGSGCSTTGDGRPAGWGFALLAMGLLAARRLSESESPAQRP